MPLLVSYRVHPVEEMIRRSPRSMSKHRTEQLGPTSSATRQASFSPRSTNAISVSGERKSEDPGSSMVMMLSDSAVRSSGCCARSCGRPTRESSGAMCPDSSGIQRGVAAVVGHDLQGAPLCSSSLTLLLSSVSLFQPSVVPTRSPPPSAQCTGVRLVSPVRAACDRRYTSCREIICR